MDVRSIQDLKRFFAKLSDKLAATDKFFTARLATRLTKAAEQNPQDHTIVQMASFLTRRSGAPSGHLISRAELHDVYKKLYTSNTKCAAYLGDELGVKTHQLPEAAPMTRSPREGESIDDLYSRHADQRMVAEFEAAFDKNATYKAYDQKVAKRAEVIVAGVLSGHPTVQAIDGRDYAILCQATYETPKGRSSVLIPVEVVNGNALVPSVFLTPSGFENLNNKLLEAHIQRTAGKFYKVNANQIFNVIKKAKFGTVDNKEELDQVDRAVMMLKSKTAGVDDVTPDGILYQKVDAETKSVQLPESKATKKFAEQLESVGGQAEFVFGKKAVDMGRYWIQRDLAEFGYKNPQIKVANISDDTVIYAVAVAGSGFKVPVKIKNNTATQPTMILTAGGIEEFTRVGIKNAMGASDPKASALAMGYDIADPAALIREVEAACHAGDINRAGDAINAINATGDERAIRYAFDVYLSALNGDQVKKSAPKMKTIKIGGNEVEATTGLPVDKLYIDESGHVQAKYRQHMDKTEDGTASGFMNAKIIMGM